MRFIFLLICLLPGYLTAQVPEVKGKVTAAGKGVPFAGVGIKGGVTGTTAGADGTFILKNLKPGQYTVQVSAVGFQSKEVAVTVLAGQENFILVELEESMARLQEVVISGTMQEVYQLESPVPVEIYTPQFFKKNPTPALFDALQIVNGVQPQLNCNVCNTGDIHINGMEGPYTMVLVDGMPIVSALATVYGLSGIPNSMIERVEVVKGPASTLYGSEAVAGLINIITKSPATAPVLSADVFATSDRELNADLGAKATVGKANTLISTSYYRMQHLLDRNQDNFTDLPLQERISVFNKWDFKRADNRIASLAARYQYEDRWGGELQWEPKWRGTDSVYGESIYTKRTELIGHYQLPVQEKMMIGFSYTGHNQNSVYGTTSYIANQQVLFGQLTWSKKLHLRHNLLAGAAFRYTYYDDNTPATATSDTTEFKNQPQHTSLPGLFVQDEWKLNEQNTLLLGFRYDYHSEHNGILTPRVNYKWSPNSSNVLRLGIGNGYRVVNLFTEDHAALTGARKVVIKNELKPEQSYNINLNYTRLLNIKSGYINVETSVFYTYFTNKIVGDFLTDPDLIIYDNLKGHAVSKGVAVNADAAFAFPLKVIAGATLLDVYQVEENQEGENVRLPQLNAPAFSATFTVSYTLRQIGVTLDYTGQVYGPMYLPVQENDFRPEKSPWFSLQNVQLTKKMKHGVEVYGGIKNLLNFRPKHPLMRPFDPFDKNVDQDNPYGYTFDTSYNYAPLQGVRGFMGVRINVK
ncbi:MAG: TonB-dependent receptor [Hymenobacteraceae bacterium]|nr:TonB-dependent receptor [Hymenobacteraceae bacterium]